jgi:hypothetical protein
VGHPLLLRNRGWPTLVIYTDIYYFTTFQHLKASSLI